MDLVDFVLDRLHHFTGIAAAQHQHDAGDHFMFSVQHGGAMPDGMPDPDFRHVPDVHRRSAHLLDDDVSRYPPAF